MKNTFKIGALFTLLLCANQAEAQFFKKLQSKIEKKIEHRLEKKAEEKAEQALDSIFIDKPSKRRKQSKRREPSSEERDLGGIDLGGMMEAMMNQEEAIYDETYTFFLTTKMQVITNGKNPMEITTSYGDGAQFILMDEGMSIINDFKNGAMITLDEKKKRATVMNSKILDIVKDLGGDDTDEEAVEVIVKATGKTKTVNGYRCKNYHITSSDTDMDIWTTTDIDFDMKEYAEKMAELFKSPSSTAMMKQHIGFPMEMITKVGNDTVEMKILEVSEKSKTVDLSKYTITSM